MERPVRRTRRTKPAYPAIAMALLLGAVLGGIAGELLRNAMPFFARHYPIGLKPTTVDLAIIAFTLGFEFKVSVAAVIGAATGAFIASRR